jgi:hypothetical protein
MNIKEDPHKVKKIERKKFFVNLGKGFAGLVLVNSLPFKLFGKNNPSSRKVEIKINPLAVIRKKDGKKNG